MSTWKFTHSKQMAILCVAIEIAVLEVCTVLQLNGSPF